MPPILLLVGALLLTERSSAARTRTSWPSWSSSAPSCGRPCWRSCYTRGLAEDFRSLLALAERGDPGTDPEIGDAYRQMASSLDERNRQVAALAQGGQHGADRRHSRDAWWPRVVSAVRSVMRDPTWRCAVLAAETPRTSSRPGSTTAPRRSRDLEPIGDLERWASVSAAGTPAAPRSRGRGEPSPSSTSRSATACAPSSTRRGRAGWTPRRRSSTCFTLVGQHAGTALEHSLLYAQRPEPGR